MKNSLWAIGWFLIFTLIAVAGYQCAEMVSKHVTVPAKTEQIAADDLPNISISNPKDGSYLTEAAAITQSSNEPYQIKQEIMIQSAGCLIVTDVIDNVDDGEGWANHFSEVVPGTTKAICAEKTRQYKLAAEWIRDIPVREDKEKKLREAWDARKPEEELPDLSDTLSCPGAPK